MISFPAFVYELKRRRVFRVLVGYCAGALVAIEAANNVFPALDLPAWTTRLVVVLALLGLPLAVGLAWAFDITPDGVRLTAGEPEPDDGGVARVRRVPRWVRVSLVAVLVLGAGVAMYARLSAAARARAAAARLAASERSIAVLPFVNLSADSASEYFSDGITEEILNALANVPGLRVTARTSSFAFKGKSLDVAEIGRQLRVTHVLEGSVQRAGDRVRISAQLIDARSGFHQWGDAYTLHVTDIFATEDEISREIARQLEVRLDPGVRLARSGTDDPRAHDLYLQGRRLIDPSGTPEEWKANILRAITTFQRVLAIDSTYALAWSGISVAYSTLADNFWPPRDAEPRAQQAALRALALDPNLSEAHQALGVYLTFYAWDFRAGERELRRAIALNPGNPLAHANLGFLYGSQRRFGDAIAELAAAAQVDPAHGVWDTQVLRYRARAGEGDRLRDSLRAVLRARPDDPTARQQLLAIAVASGHWREGAATLAEARRRLPAANAGWLPESALLALAGDTLAARRVLAAILAESRDHYKPGYYIAAAYVALGDHETALQWLDRAVRERDATLLELDVGLYWEPLRGDPRFEAIRRRVGLPPRRG